jgi:hypothetical protein
MVGLLDWFIELVTIGRNIATGPVPAFTGFVIFKNNISVRKSLLSRYNFHTLADFITILYFGGMLIEILHNRSWNREP